MTTTDWWWVGAVTVTYKIDGREDTASAWIPRFNKPNTPNIVTVSCGLDQAATAVLLAGDVPGFNADTNPAHYNTEAQAACSQGDTLLSAPSSQQSANGEAFVQGALDSGHELEASSDAYYAANEDQARSAFAVASKPAFLGCIVHIESRSGPLTIRASQLPSPNVGDDSAATRVEATFSANGSAVTFDVDATAVRVGRLVGVMQTTSVYVDTPDQARPFPDDRRIQLARVLAAKMAKALAPVLQPPQASVEAFVFVHGVRSGCDDPGQTKDQGVKSYKALFDKLVGQGEEGYSFCYDHDKAFGHTKWDHQRCFSPTSHGPEKLVNLTVPFDRSVAPLSASQAPDDAHNSTSYDTNGPLAYDATKLDDCLAALIAGHGGARVINVAIIGNSMGGAITRGWLQLAKARHSTALLGVTTVLFLEGAVEGSWVAGAGENLSGTLGVFSRVDPLIGPEINAIAHDIAIQNEIEPSRPGIGDLRPGSEWYKAIVASGDPPDLNYFTFSVDLLFTAHVQYLFWGTDVGFDNLGDGLMQLGDPSPSGHPDGGGSRFLPWGEAPNRHQYTVIRQHDVGQISAIVLDVPNPVGIGKTVIDAVTTDPYGHFSFGDRIGDDVVVSCDPGFDRPSIPGEIRRVLENPSSACNPPSAPRRTPK